MIFQQLFRIFRIKSGFRSNQLRNYSRNLWSYEHRQSNRQLVNVTYGDLLEKCVLETPDRLAVVCPHQSIRKTFEEFRKDVHNVAAGLLSTGLNKGSKIAVLSPNYYEWVVLQYAIPCSGYVLTTLNPALTEREIIYALQKADVSALLFADEFKGKRYIDLVNKIIPDLDRSKPGELKVKEIPTLKYAISMFDEIPGILNLKDISSMGLNEEMRNSLERRMKENQSDDCVNIQFTSGTTGKPKAAALSHHSIINNALCFAQRYGIIPENDKICVQVPLFHCFGNSLGSTTMACFNTTIVLPSSVFDSTASLKAIDSEKCTLIYGSPTMFIDMLNNENFSKYSYESMRGGIMAASTCPPQLLKDINKQLNMRDVCVAYGTTENSPLITMNEVDDSFEHRCNTVGRVVDHIEVKIVDSEGKIVKRGESGELYARGYQVMLGYYKDEEKSKEVYGQDRWYKTGDLSTMDEYGYISIVGRIKDMIIRGGENIYPKEIEDFLITNPSIIDAQIFGIPDERLGEVVCAWIKRKPNSELTSKEVREFCKNQIASFKIPKHVKFVNEYPTTTSGKVQKFAMVEAMIGELNNGS